MESENYYRLWSIYDSVATAPNLIEATTQLNMLVNSSYFVASRDTRTLFHMKKSDVRSLGSYNTTDTNKFISDTERKTKAIICASLSDYVKYLQGFRWGDNKCLTLYAYLIFDGLYNILGDIFIPDHLKELVNSAISEINERAVSILKETQDYFINKNIPELAKAIISLDTLLMTYRRDRLISMLQGIYPELSSEDIEFLDARRLNYSKFVTDMDHKIIYEKFGISDTSYYRNLNTIVNDLSSKLSDTEIELLTALFLKR
jgi:hypothetical protein